MVYQAQAGRASIPLELTFRIDEWFNQALGHSFAV